MKRPKPRPTSKLAPATSPRPRTRSDAEIDAAFDRAMKHSQPDKMAKGGKISEYGGKETYKSKAAKRKHEAKESPAYEKREKRMASGGMCRGMGAATKGGKYGKSG